MPRLRKDAPQTVDESADLFAREWVQYLPPTNRISARDHERYNFTIIHQTGALLSSPGIPDPEVTDHASFIAKMQREGLATLINKHLPHLQPDSGQE